MLAPRGRFRLSYPADVTWKANARHGQAEHRRHLSSTHFAPISWVRARSSAVSPHPALDALAADSVRFNRCFTEPGPTLQVRNGCFTGMRGFPYTHGYYGWHKVPDEHPTIAEILLEQGYATGLIGDTPHLFKPNMNHSRGFMSWEHIRGAGGDGWRTGSWDLIRDLFKDYFGAYEPALPEASDSSLHGESGFLQHLHNARDPARRGGLAGCAGLCIGATLGARQRAQRAVLSVDRLLRAA